MMRMLPDTGDYREHYEDRKSYLWDLLEDDEDP